MGEEPKVARAALHMWEEPCISGTRGSGTIFFSGCNLQCAFCQNYALSHDGYGKAVTVEGLRAMMRKLVAQDAHNINLVTPTPFLQAIARALDGFDPGVPVVFNSGGYEWEAGLELMRGKVDIYLPDLKYHDNTLGQRLSRVPDYFDRASHALEVMYDQVGSPVIENGLMKRGLWVRHLVLPGHLDDSLAVLEWLSRTFGRKIGLSVMIQYTPCGHIEAFPELHRRLTTLEYQKILRAVDQLDLDGYVQERSSAREEYIPPFDLTGVE